MSIFITGNSRSGTTMMSRILGNHADVFSFQELHFFDEQFQGKRVTKESAIKLYAKLCAIQRNGYFGNHTITPFYEEAKQSIGEFIIFSEMEVYKKFIFDEAKRNHKKIPCKQTPQNIFYINEILEIFTDARVVVMIRDPREVLLSQKNKWKRRKLSGGEIPLWEALRSRINYHPITISKIWNAAAKQGLLFKNDKRVLTVHFEKLVSDPENVIKEVCEHVGISYSNNLLDIPVVGSSNKTDNSQIRGVDKNKTGQWNQGGLNTTEIAICEKINSALMQQVGYNLSEIPPNILLQSWYYFSLPFRVALALLFNLKRLKNSKKIVKRFLNS